MTEYNSVKVKLSGSQLSKLKSTTKNATGITLRLLSNIIGHKNDETNFLHKLLVTNRKVSNFVKVL